MCSSDLVKIAITRLAAGRYRLYRAPEADVTAEVAEPEQSGEAED